MKESSLFSLKIFRQVCIILPCLIILAVYMISQNAFQYSMDVSNIDLNSLKVSLSGLIFRRIVLIIEFFLFSTYTFSKLQLVSTSIFSFVIVMLSYESFKALKRQYSEKNSLAEDDKLCVMILIAMSMIYLFAPFRLGVGCFFNQRFPWVILLFSIPLFSNLSASLLKKATAVFLFVAISFVVINSAIFYDKANQISKALLGTNIGISPSTYMMTYREKGTSLYGPDHMLHIASYYGIYNSVVDIGNYQAFVSKSLFPVVFKNDSSEIPSIYQIEIAPENIKWELYPKVKYLAAIGEKEGDWRMRDIFRKIFEIENFSIWVRKEL